ncbi:MAG TPA: PAS domain S-box protein [Candidatus Polarisedimenticolaceae bacterium]|nr:PAS domain S-box protein [Candidatus Polarisedimenticolaceae bacterium]
MTHRLRAVSRGAAGAVVAVGAAVLVGWVFDVRALKSVAIGLATMKANTALAFALAGCSLWLQTPRPRPRRRRIGRSCAAAVLLLGAMTLVEYLVGVDSWFDQALFADPAPSLNPGRMAPSTALLFVLAGAALLLLDAPRRRWISSALALTGLGTALFALVGYAYGVEALYHLAPFSSMALHTASCFVLLAVGTVTSRPRRGIMPLLTGDAAGGLLARRVLPATLGVPFALGWLRLAGERSGLVESATGTAMVALGNALVLTTIALLIAASLQRTDLERRVVADRLESVRGEVGFLHDVLDQSAQPFWVADAEGRLVRSNRALERLVGFDVEELHALSVFDLVADSNEGAERQRMTRLLRSGVATRYQQLYVRKDGTRVTVEIAVELHRAASGAPHLVAFVTDMTERDRAQRALDESEERFRLLIEGVQDFAIFMLDPGGHVVSWNRAAERIKGYEAHEVLGQHVGCFYTAADRAQGLPERELKIAADVGRCEREGRRLRKDGSSFWANVVLTALRDPQGRLRGYAKVTRDISQHRAAEERFRVAVEAAPNAMVMIDAAGSILLVNAQTEKLFGYGRDELLGQSVELLVPERFRGRHPGHRQAFFAAPAVRAMGAGRELYGRRKDGGEFPVEIGLNPIETEHGRVVLSAIVDITERKRAEERFRIAVESAPNAMVMIDADGRIVLVNAQTEKLFGYGRDELLGQSVDLLVPERFRGRHPGHREKFFAAPAVRSMGAGRELYGRRKDGGEFPVEIGLNPIETEQGPVVLSAIVDITERKRAEERFRIAVESAPNAMVMIDADGRIVLVNAQTEKLFGYGRDELLGQAIELLVPERFHAHHPGHRRAFFAAPAVREMGAGRDLYGLRKDGSEFPVEIGLNPIATEQGLVVLSAIVDITERKRKEEVLHELHLELEQRVAQRTAALEAANAELESFSYSVSHDLRAPLRAIDGFSRILLSDHAEALPGEAQDYLRDVRSATQRMGELVDDLLAFSRLGRQALRGQLLEPEALVRQCWEELRPQCAGRSVELEVGELPACIADGSLLKQVWTNLLSNAVKYSAKRGDARIEVGSAAGATPEECVYFVRDNGVGFDMRYAHKLFGVFQRLHRAEEYEGTGVGLAVVQRVVQRHGGRAWAESAPDRGATFYFSLPRGGVHHEPSRDPAGRGQSERPEAGAARVEEQQRR